MHTKPMHTQDETNQSTEASLPGQGDTLYGNKRSIGLRGNQVLAGSMFVQVHVCSLVWHWLAMDVVLGVALALFHALTLILN